MFNRSGLNRNLCTYYFESHLTSSVAKMILKTEILMSAGRSLTGRLYYCFVIFLPCTVHPLSRLPCIPALIFVPRIFASACWSSRVANSHRNFPETDLGTKILIFPHENVRLTFVEIRETFRFPFVYTAGVGNLRPAKQYIFD